MQETHWAEAYIGKPWARGASGPEAFDCWGLVCWVYRVQYHKDVPRVELPSGDLRLVTKAFQRHPERHRWQRVLLPQEGDVLLMGQGRFPSHTGIYVALEGGGVVHALEKVGVIYQSLQDLTLSGFYVEGAYRLSG